RRFLKSSPIRTIYEYAKFTVPGEYHKNLELTFNRVKLEEKLNMSIEDGDLCNSTIVVDY
ncbi:hypothetical protein BB558_004158, partial [Smittium angustum]